MKKLHFFGISVIFSHFCFMSCVLLYVVVLVTDSDFCGVFPSIYLLEGDFRTLLFNVEASFLSGGCIGGFSFDEGRFEKNYGMREMRPPMPG